MFFSILPWITYKGGMPDVLSHFIAAIVLAVFADREIQENRFPAAA